MAGCKQRLDKGRAEYEGALDVSKPGAQKSSRPSFDSQKMLIDVDVLWPLMGETSNRNVEELTVVGFFRLWCFVEMSDGVGGHVLAGIVAEDRLNREIFGFPSGSLFR